MINTWIRILAAISLRPAVCQALCWAQGEAREADVVPALRTGTAVREMRGQAVIHQGD